MGLPDSLDDRERVSAAFRDSHACVYRLLRRHGFDEELADDAAQQAFLVLLRRISDLDQGKERSFLRSSALFIARRLWVRAAREARLERDPDELLALEELRPDEIVEARLRRAFLDGILAQMDDDLRVVLYLADVEGKGKREIAHVLGIPVGTAASRLRRARGDLRARVRRTVSRMPA